MKNSLERAAKRRVHSYAKLTTEQISNLPHDEYIKQGIARLRDNLEEILNRQDKIELNELTLLGMDKISAYMSLLFLTASSDYDLEQNEFYSDLYVVKRPHSESTAEESDENIMNVESILADSEAENGTVEIKS